MAIRPTSKWVDIDLLVAHPDNPNHMSDEEFSKLEANVGIDGEIPPIIVRSLELTQQYEEERNLDKLQIIDGEHRWRLAKKLDHKKVEIRIWAGVTDQKSKHLLLTLNRLHGKDDKAKRGRLVRDMAEIEQDYEALATILPETAEQIQKIIDEVNREAVEDATSRARTISERQPMTIFVMPEQAEKIRRALKLAQGQMDKSHQHVDCEEGAALALIAVRYLESIKAPI